MIKNDYPFTFSDYTPVFQNKNSVKKLIPTKIENKFTLKKIYKKLINKYFHYDILKEKTLKYKI